MYTLLINNDNTVTATVTHPIMQRSKLVDDLYFIVPKMYNKYDMSEFSFVMEYRTPISHTYNYKVLVLTDPDYKQEYLRYTIDIDTDLTSENGELELNLKFIGTFMQADGTVLQQVRELAPCTITIVPIASWFTAPDEALDTLTQMIIANQQNIKATVDLAGVLNQSKADDIYLDKVNKELYVTVHGKKSGTPIPLSELGDELAEATEKGLVKMNI